LDNLGEDGLERQGRIENNMQYRTLGRTGLRVSEVGFGGAPAGITGYIEAWDSAAAAERASVVRAIRRGLELGLNYLDTAPGYGAGLGEEIFGEAITGRRGEVVLATKTGARDPAGIVASVEQSLKRLGTDRVDLLQFHGGWYGAEDVELILRRGGLEAYQRLREQGKVRFLGFTAEGPSGGVSELIATGAFDVLQCRYNLLSQHTCDYVNEAGIIREAKAMGMGVVTMRTLTSGVFQQLMRREFPEQIAGIDLTGFLLNYVLSNPHIDVALIGMRRVEEVEVNNALSDDTARRLDLAALHVRHVAPPAAGG
jgi:aryl-alcohol dehydrogenase-like predicted oxidoreductase